MEEEEEKCDSAYRTSDNMRGRDGGHANSMGVDDALLERQQSWSTAHNDPSEDLECSSTYYDVHVQLRSGDLHESHDFDEASKCDNNSNDSLYGDYEGEDHFASEEGINPYAGYELKLSSGAENGDILQNSDVGDIRGNASNFNDPPLSNASSTDIMASTNSYQCDVDDTDVEASSHQLDINGTDITSSSHECVVCHVSFPSARQLNTHYTLHTQSCKCVPCSRVYHDLQELMRHMIDTHSDVKLAMLHTGEGIYACRVCDEVVHKYWQLISHMTKHTVEKPHRCTCCGKTFSNFAALCAHVRLHHPQAAAYRCATCDKTFNDPAHLKNHVQIHTGERRFRCNVCHKGFKRLWHLHGHMHTHLDELPFKCPVDDCSRKFSNSSNMYSHVKIHHPGIAAYKCKFCDLKFSESIQYKLHLREHAGQRPHKCTICSKSFKQEKTLKRHENTHRDGDKQNACEYCGKTFRQRVNLEDHLKTHTGEKPYTCAICGKGFLRSPHLTSHMRTHTGEKPYKCGVCGWMFGHSSSLKTHMKTRHVSEKPFPCRVCFKAFSTRGILRAHLKTHSQERPHQCTNCGKCFKLKANLKRHSLIHTGVRPYICSVCGKGFSAAGNLSGHMRTHSSERAYRCLICHKAFNHPGNLKSHMRLHTGERPYRCGVCGKGCIDSSSLSHHLQTHDKVPDVVASHPPAQAQDTVGAPPAILPPPPHPYRCEPCNLTFPLPAHLNAHLQSQEHVLSQQSGGGPPTAYIGPPAVRYDTTPTTIWYHHTQ